MMSSIIYSIAEVFIIFAIGALARHLKYIQETDLNHWSKLIIDFLFPMLVFSSIVQNFQTNQTAGLWIMPTIGFGMMAFGAVCGYILKIPMRNSSPDRLKTFHHFCAINNYGFLPLIIITNLWGDKLLPDLFILNIGSNIGYWTIGIALLSKGDWKTGLKNMLTPMIITLVIALLVVLCGVRGYVPHLIVKVCHFVGGNAVPFMLLIIGASLYDTPRVTLRHAGEIGYLCFVRLLLLPILMILILKALPLSESYYNIAFVVALMPTSVSSTIITRCYGGSPQYAAQAALITTIASIFTIPILMYFR